jgi:hypothetical protein
MGAFFEDPVPKFQNCRTYGLESLICITKPHIEFAYARTRREGVVLCAHDTYQKKSEVGIARKYCLRTTYVVCPKIKSLFAEFPSCTLAAGPSCGANWNLLFLRRHIIRGSLRIV